MQEASAHTYAIGPASQAIVGATVSIRSTVEEATREFRLGDIVMPPRFASYEQAAADLSAVGQAMMRYDNDTIVEAQKPETRIDGVKIFDITKNNFAGIIDPDSSRRSKQVKSLNYIMFLASSMGVDISEWNVKEVFTNQDGTIYVDKGHINQAFFTEVDRLRSMAVYGGPTNVISPDLAKALAVLSTRNISGLSDRIRRSLTQNYIRAENFYSSYILKLQDCARENADLVRLQGKDGLSVATEVQKIIDSGRWKLVSGMEDLRNSSHIRLETTADIVCRHVNHRAGVDMTVNLGRAVALVVFGSMPNIEVQRGGSNLVLADGFWHPHISNHGNICWGNVSSEVDQLITTWSLSRVFEILNSVLNDYNHANPYVAIETFHKYEADGGRRIATHERSNMLYCDEHEVEYPRDGECEMCVYDQSNGPDF